jgi:AraC-like DNA-binding protein
MATNREVAEDASAQPLSDYREFLPPLKLASHFLCFWTQRVSDSQSAYHHRVLPDGCVDIVFINNDPPVAVGPWTDPFVTEIAAGTQILGARLHPGLAANFLGLPADELLNQSAPLDAIWSKAKSAQLDCVYDQQTLSARSTTLAETLSKIQELSAPDRIVLASIQWLARNPGGRVEELSQFTGISQRQLQRRFCAAVGYGPKMFHSVLRFQRLLRLARRNGQPQSLADLAAAAGYSDQPHMTREVRRFASCLPSELFPSSDCTLQMSDLFKTNVSPAEYL